MDTPFRRIGRRSAGRSSLLSAGNAPGAAGYFSRKWYRNQFLICFFAGLMAGTVLANFFYAALSNQAGYYLNLLSRRLSLGKDEKISLFVAVCRQRGIEGAVLWLMGLTAYAVPCLCLFCFGVGLSMGAVMSVITGQTGLLGLPFFVASIMPQALCYVPVACLFLWRLARGDERLKPAGILLVLAAVLAGSACEVWLNPHVLEGAQSFFSV